MASPRRITLRVDLPHLDRKPELPGHDRVHINLWLLNGRAPVNDVGNEMIINSFSFQP